MEAQQITFNFWIFFSNALCALALNVSVFLVIGRTGAITVRVAGVLKDWILIALSTLVFPESKLTGLNIIGYAIALTGVVTYNYLKLKESHAGQLPSDAIPEKLKALMKEKKLEKKSSEVYDGNATDAGGANSATTADEEAPLISRLSHMTGRVNSSQ